MTESKWLASEDPTAMLGWANTYSDLHDHSKNLKISERKLRLFACAAARLDPLWPTWHEASPPKVSVFRTEECVEAGQPNHNFDDRGSRDQGFFWAVCRAQEAARMAADGPERRALAALLRDVIGNPFRSVTVRDLYRALFVPWLTPQVLSLAQAAYSDRAPDGTLDPFRLLVLADALEDAGCTDADLLAHLRSPGAHVRGCWALDLILGRD